MTHILDKYNATGLLQHVSQWQGDYVDLCDAPTYHEAMNVIVESNEAFQTLPANVRERFANDPERFLAFVNNSENAEEMEKLGLIENVTQPVSVESEPPQTPQKEKQDDPPKEEKA